MEMYVLRTASKSVPGPAVLFRACGANPIDGMSARIGLGETGGGAVTIAKPGDFEAAHLLPSHIWHVDVEDGIGWERVGF